MLALITKKPHAIVEILASDPANINIPGKWQAHGVSAGWHSSDGFYSLVAVRAFVPPKGKMVVGQPSYKLEGDGVVEMYETENIPPPPAPAKPTVDDLKAELVHKIRAIEDGQHRAVREAALGMDGAVDRLKEIDAKIAALRSDMSKIV